MFRQVVFLLAAICLCVGGDKLCLSDEVCGTGCPSGGLHFGKCLDQRCVCVSLPGKRGTDQYIIEGDCDNNDQCHERCAPTGMFWGNCLGDRCFCYTLMGKRSPKRFMECQTSAQCSGFHACGGEFGYSAICMNGICGCGRMEIG